MLRVGHGGASALATGNTLASFETARRLGIDMIEFDVRERYGRLVLAHSPLALRRPCLDLDDALAYVGSPAFDGIQFNLDVKQPGIEAPLLAALRRHDLTRRALISSQMAAVLDRVRELDPSVRTGVSIGGRIARRRHSWGDWRGAVAEAVARRRFDALMAHHRLVDASLVRAIRAAGGELFAWTVDDRARVDSLREAGVSGIVTNDPRIFATA